MKIFDFPGDRGLPDAMQFSPDGRLLAVQSFSRVAVLDTETGKTWRFKQGITAKVGTAGIGFTADSRSVVYFAYTFRKIGSTVNLFHLAGKKKSVLFQSEEKPGHPRGDLSICTTKLDGSLVFVAVEPEDRTVEIVALDPLSGERKFSFARHKSYIRELAVSPEGDWVAACSTKDLRVWSIGGGKLTNRAGWHLMDRSISCFGNLAIARNGEYIAAGIAGGRGRLTVWDLKTKTQIPLGGERGSSLTFAPDRPLLAFTQENNENGEVVFWDVEHDIELKRYDWGLGSVRAVAFSPDGLRCATASETQVVVWNVDV